MIKKQFITVALMLAIVFVGCKKAETGPAGPQGPVITLASNGFITGTVTGTHRDGSTMYETFNFQKYIADGNQPAGTLDSINSSMYYYQINRYIDLFSNNSAQLFFSTNSKSAATGTLNLSFSLEKKLSNNKIFVFNPYINVANISSIIYNSTTGIVTGNFSANIPGGNNNTGNPATITGSFQSNVTELYYIKKQTLDIKTD